MAAFNAEDRFHLSGVLMSTSNSNNDEVNLQSLTSNVILGQSGNLGREFLKLYGASIGTIPIDRQLTRSWISEGSVSDIRSYLQAIRKNTQGLNLFVCTGMTDPKKEFEVNLVNNLFPKKIVEASENLDIKIITFGTVQEDWNLNNHYIDSKRQFSVWLEQLDADYVHNFKLHSLYGGVRTDNNLFLSQIIRSLESGRKFKMSSGLQIREYHHQAQVTEYIDYFLKSEALDHPHHISHGQPVSLRNLAEYIFDRFCVKELLDIDHSINVQEDNFNRVYDRTIPGRFNPDFSLVRIGDWIERRLHE